MAAKRRERIEDHSSARSPTKAPAERERNTAAENSTGTSSFVKDTNMMPFNTARAQTLSEGVSVIGEAVRRATPDGAEFLVEVTASAPTAAQALRENQVKMAQMTQAISLLGVQPADLQTISLKVHNLYTPTLPGYAGMPQIGQGGYPSYGTGAPAVQPEVQLGSYHARSVLRVSAREPGRIGEIADAAIRAGGAIIGGFSLRASDEAGARRAALEAAAKDARLKAESLAVAAGRQLGEPIAVTEDFVASDGLYAALRSATPFALGAGAPEYTGEFEYYARVSASFRFHDSKRGVAVSGE